jgi:hypothetical protein
MSDLQPIGDRVEIEGLGGEFTDATMIATTTAEHRRNCRRWRRARPLQHCERTLVD